MLIQLNKEVQQSDVEAIVSKVNALGYSHNQITTQVASYIICIGKKEIDLRQIGGLKGVQDVFKVSDAYKLTSTKWKVGKTKVDIGDGIGIGNGEFQIMAGPCSIESEEQIKSTIEHLKANKIKIMRGGVYKPRSSPYSFRGLGMDGLRLW